MIGVVHNKRVGAGSVGLKRNTSSTGIVAETKVCPQLVTRTCKGSTHRFVVSSTSPNRNGFFRICSDIYPICGVF